MLTFARITWAKHCPLSFSLLPSVHGIAHAVTHPLPTCVKMAFIETHRNGWRALVAPKGIRKSQVLSTRQEAKDWAALEEYMILNGQKVAAAAYSSTRRSLSCR